MSNIESIYLQYFEAFHQLSAFTQLEKDIDKKINDNKQAMSNAERQQKNYMPPLREQMQTYLSMNATLESGLQEVRLLLMELRSRISDIRQSLNDRPLTSSETQGVLSDALYVVAAEPNADELAPLSMIRHQGKPVVFLYKTNNANTHLTAHLEPFLHQLIQGVYRTNAFHSVQLHIIDTITGAKAFQTPLYMQNLGLKVYEKIDRIRELMDEVKQNTRAVVDGGHADISQLNRKRIQTGDKERKYQIVLVLIPPLEESISFPDEWWQELHDGVKTGFLPLFFVADSDWRTAQDHHRTISRLKKHVTASHVYHLDLKHQSCHLSEKSQLTSMTDALWDRLQRVAMIKKGLSTDVHFSTIEIKVGCYIRFGQYYDEPILWRVIHVDEQGDPLLLSDRILTIKAFDAKGSYHEDSDRQKYGSNEWAESNLRQWLNSSEQRIGWKQNPPSTVNMYEGHNAYDQERGFLAPGNFSPRERDLIKPLKHKVLLAEIDKGKKEGGTEKHEYNSGNPADALQNYDQSYYQMVTDKVFCLSLKQLAEYVYGRRNILGEDYHKARPTAQAVAFSSYKNSEASDNNNWYYWLSCPDTEYSGYVRTVGNDGSINDCYATYDDDGVRPALQLNLSSAIFTSEGAGTESKPYVIKR